MPTTAFRLSALSLALIATSTAQAQTPPPTDTPQDDSYVLDTVQVKSSAAASAGGLSDAYAGGQVATGGLMGILGNQSVMETPFNYTVYTEQLIEDQQASSVADIVLNDPAVRVARGFGNYQQVYIVRGLPIFSDDVTYNGLYGLLPRQYLASEFIERVQVFRGANTFLKGAAPGGSGLGGAINIVPKRAPNRPLTEITLGTQSGGQSYAAADLAERSDDGRFGIRVNVARHDGDSAVDGQSAELSMASVGLDFRGERLRLSADLGFQKHRIDGGQPSITFAPGVPILETPDADESIGQAWTYSYSRDLFGTLRAEYDFTDSVTGWAAFGTRRSEEEAIFANPTVYNAQGDYRAYRFDSTREDQVVTGEAGVRFQFRTGAVGHKLSLSGATYELRSHNAYGMSGSTVTGNIYNPTPVAAPPATLFTGGDLGDPGLTYKTQMQSLALADQLSMLDERLLVTLGARYQKLQNTDYAYGSGNRTGQYEDDAITPTLGILYKLTPSLSLYANYIEGLTRGDTAAQTVPGTNPPVPVVNAGESLKPYKTKQEEIGLKFDTGTLGGSVAVYRSRKPVAGYNANNKFEVVDHRESTGLELMAYGKPTRNLTVLGGVSFLETDVDGNEAIGTPNTQANVNLEYRPPMFPDLALNGRVIYTSSQYADSANTQELDAWTRLDLGARYLIMLGSDSFLTLRGRVENVTGEDYWASAGGYPGAGYLTIGAPRTLLFSATFNF